MKADSGVVAHRLFAQFDEALNIEPLNWWNTWQIPVQAASQEDYGLWRSSLASGRPCLLQELWICC